MRLYDEGSVEDLVLRGWPLKAACVLAGRPVPDRAERVAILREASRPDPCEYRASHVAARVPEKQILRLLDLWSTADIDARDLLEGLGFHPGLTLRGLDPARTMDLAAYGDEWEAADAARGRLVSSRISAGRMRQARALRAGGSVSVSGA